MSKKEKVPISSEARGNLWGNAFVLLFFVVVAIGGGMFLDFLASKAWPSAYDGLYKDRAVVLKHSASDQWRSDTYYDDSRQYEEGYWRSGEDAAKIERDASGGEVRLDGEPYHIHGLRKYYGDHPYFTQVINGREEAQRGTITAYGGDGERKGGELYPAPEWKLLKCFVGFVAALLLLTPLGPQHYLPRRRQYLKENRVDYAMSLGVAEWLAAQGDPFAGDKGAAEPAMIMKPLRVEINPNSDTVAEQDEYGRWHSRTIADPLRAGFTLFAEDGAGKTWCISAPSTQMTREFVRKTVEGWVGNLSPNTHVGQVMQEYSFGKYEPRALPTLNAIIGDMTRNGEVKDRTEIIVSGTVVDDKGLLIATSFSTGGARDVFLPTAFMAALTGEVKKLTGRELPAAQPKLLAA